MMWWVAVGANLLTWCLECFREVFCAPSFTPLFSIVQNKFYGYADDATLVAVVPSPAERVAVTESLNRDLNRVSVWCDLHGMKLNARIVSRSRTVHPPVDPIDSGWNCGEGIC